MQWYRTFDTIYSIQSDKELFLANYDTFRVFVARPIDTYHRICYPWYILIGYPWYILTVWYIFSKRTLLCLIQTEDRKKTFVGTALPQITIGICLFDTYNLKWRYLMNMIHEFWWLRLLWYKKDSILIHEKWSLTLQMIHTIRNDTLML